MPKLVFNAVSLHSAPDAKIPVGTHHYDQALLAFLREKHRGSYFMKRGGGDGNSILSVALRSGLEPLTCNISDQEVASAPWLLAPLAVDALLRFFVGLGRPVLRWRPLRVLSACPGNIYPSENGLPDWLQRRLVLNFETRTVRGNDGTPVVVLACDVRTRNIIDASCADLLKAGMPVIGRYVATPRPSGDPRIIGPLRLVGRVKEIRGSSLLLDDHGDNPDRIDASNAVIEPRKENMTDCVRHFLGTRADSVLQATEDAAAQCLSGPERLSLIRKTFDYLRDQNIELAPGVPLVFGSLGGDRGGWAFRSETIQRPALVFDPSGTRTDRWNERGLDANGPYDQRTFAPKKLRIAVVCQAAYEGQVEEFLAKFLDGLPEIKTGSGDRVRAPYAKGFIRRYALEAPKLQVFAVSGASARDYAAACRRAIDAATDGGFEWDLAIIQIDQDFKELPGPDNPYFITKSLFLKQRVPVQEITLETMRFPNQQLVYVLNNISLATYAKLGGVPWLLKSQPTVAHELVIGLGSQNISTSRLGTGERVVGITTVFSSDGKYLLDDRTAAVPYSEYRHALLKSLTRSITEVRRVDNWRSTDGVRLIFHVFKQLADDEAKAVGALVDSLGLEQVKYAFLHIVDDHPFTIFDESNPGFRQRDGLKGKFVPDRGVSIALGDSKSLLCLTGARDVKQARHGMPLPVLLRLHRGSTFRDMTYLTRQAFDFACHSWRMFNPAPVPITIHYSELIARLLAGLRHVPTWDPDTMLGPISRTRWFL